MDHLTPSLPITSLEEALARCRDQKLRLSLQRRYILELLWQTDAHLSARDIYNRLTQQGKSIGYTSVYQNLDALAHHGIIERLERVEGRLYGRFPHTHSHINCLDDQRILDIDIVLPPELIAQVEAQTGVRIHRYQIDFYGVQASGFSGALGSDRSSSSGDNRSEVDVTDLVSDD